MFPGVVGNHAAVHHPVPEDAGVVGAVQDAAVVPHHYVVRRPRVPVHVVLAGRMREKEFDDSNAKRPVVKRDFYVDEVLAITGDYVRLSRVKTLAATN